MAQKLRVPIGFVLAAIVLYLAEPTVVSILVGLPFALIGGIFRALAAGVIRKDSVLAGGWPGACDIPADSISKRNGGEEGGEFVR